MCDEADDMGAGSRERHSPGALAMLLLADAMIWVVAVIAVLVWLR